MLKVIQWIVLTLVVKDFQEDYKKVFVLSLAAGHTVRELAGFVLLLPCTALPKIVLFYEFAGIAILIALE